jgi:hypothetical protein
MRRDESARDDTDRRVAAAQRHATSLSDCRTHNQSAFTHKSTPSEIDNSLPPAGLASGIAPGVGLKVVGHRLAGIPSCPATGRDHPMIISTLYLPETTANVRHQRVPSRSVCAGQMNCSVMTGTVQENFDEVNKNLKTAGIGAMTCWAHWSGFSMTPNQ